MLRKIVGLAGFAGSGKSTVANIFVEEHGYTKLSFATPLKQMLRTLDPVLDAHGTRISDVLAESDENTLKSRFPEYRRLLQMLGTDCIRDRDPEFWIAQLDKVAQKYDKVIIDDVRFMNEAEYIWNHSGFDIGTNFVVERPGVVSESSHSSETLPNYLKKRTITIYNDSDLEHLRKKVRDLA